MNVFRVFAQIMQKYDANFFGGQTNNFGGRAHFFP
jgi:hypothetical protein